VIIGGSGTVIIGTVHTAAPASSISSPVAKPGLCLPCLLAAAARNDALVPLESLVAKPCSQPLWFARSKKHCVWGGGILDSCCSLRYSSALAIEPAVTDSIGKPVCTGSGCWRAPS